MECVNFVWYWYVDGESEFIGKSLWCDKYLIEGN